ncbi:hypothetical protein AB0I82_35485 [Streptomyces sp. NPDC050315]|uniref:hypothetical protein n=1 Tax=Streptomyces sp. NPDC050315 TaxID=3155039 RepID=UPI00343769CB
MEDNGRGAFETWNTGGTYTSADGGVLSYTGTFTDGSFAEPSEKREEMSKDLHDEPDFSFPVSETEYTPKGSSRSMTCGVMVHTSARTTMPYCMWADRYTYGSVSRIDSGDARTAAPSSIDMEAFADWASGIRDEVRIPVK